eukprot:1630245-Prymnesium_polylepis.1
MAASAATLKQLKEAFDEYDADGSGTLDRVEFAQATRRFSLTPVTDSEIEAMFAQIDTDGSGKGIAPPRFSLRRGSHSVPMPAFWIDPDPRPIAAEERKTRRASFQAFDTDGSGAISVAEVRHYDHAFYLHRSHTTLPAGQSTLHAAGHCVHGC